MADDLFYYGTYLVDLNGINDKILSFVVIFLGCLLEAVASFLDTVVQDVGETNQYEGPTCPGWPIRPSVPSNRLSRYPFSGLRKRVLFR